MFWSRLAWAQPLSSAGSLFVTRATECCWPVRTTVVSQSTLVTVPSQSAMRSKSVTHQLTCIQRAQIIGVSFGQRDPMGLETVQAYEAALEEAKCKGIRVRALLLCNPHNPLGRWRETLQPVPMLTDSRPLLYP